MNTFILIILAIAALSLALGVSTKLPLPFRTRSCQGKGWRQAFPDSTKENIRSFLTIFVDAFAFKDIHRLKFSPEDKILGIYKTLYPKPSLSDSLELETLASTVEKKYGIDFSSVWNEQLTLGELFAATQKRLTAQSRFPQ